MLAVLYPLPAVADFLRHEVFGLKDRNSLRIGTGFLLGGFCAFIIQAMLQKAWVGVFAGTAWILALEFYVMAAMRRHGKLDDYARRYEEAVLRNKQGD